MAAPLSPHQFRPAHWGNGMEPEHKWGKTWRYQNDEWTDEPTHLKSMLGSTRSFMEIEQSPQRGVNSKDQPNGGYECGRKRSK
jgi:hypothetical protein